MARAALLVAATATAGWVWMCFCLYPSHDWNAMRLAPSFMLRAGLSPYPGPFEGPVTTWIYGPVPILLQWPATFTGNATAALLTADAINLLITLVPLWIAVWSARQPDVTRASLAWAGLLALAAWPGGYLIFSQADNSAVAFGLLGIAAVAGAAPTATLRLWLGALAAALALWSKQTELAPLLGQVAYLLIRHGSRAAIMQALRGAAAAGLLGLVLLPLCGAEGLLFNMFVVPAGIPWADFFAKAVHPIYRIHVFFDLALPVALVAFCARRFFRRDSPVLLPVLVFAFSLPFNVAGFASIGGNVNSLHGVLYLLPAAAVWLAGQFQVRPAGAPVRALLVLLAIVAVQCAGQWPLPRRPALAALQQGESLAVQLRGQVYFPWNPLFTWFSDGRFDHAEDGLLTRMVAGRPVPAALIYRYLPPGMCVVAYHHAITDGLVKRLIPAEAKRVQYGEWTLFSWSPPNK